MEKNVFSAIVKHAIDSLNEGIISASVRAKFPDYQRALEQQRHKVIKGMRDINATLTSRESMLCHIKHARKCLRTTCFFFFTTKLSIFASFPFCTIEATDKRLHFCKSESQIRHSTVNQALKHSNLLPL